MVKRHIQLRLSALSLTVSELFQGIKQFERRSEMPTWMQSRHQFINKAHPTRLRYIVGLAPLPEE